jgi:5'-3' exonuclease
MTKGLQQFLKHLKKEGKLLNNDYTKHIYVNELSRFSIKKVAIDLSCFIHKFNSTKSNKNYIVDFISLIELFNDNNIKIIFVFDGKPPIEKGRVLKDRKDKRQKNINTVKKYEEDLQELQSKSNDVNNIINEDKTIYETEIENIKRNINKFKKRSFSIKKYHITLLKQLFDLLKIAYIHLDNEADLTISNLIKQGYVDACLSDDYDMISFQSTLIIRDLNLYKKSASIINLNDLCLKTKLKPDQLTYLNIMLGCDYSNAITNINLSYMHSLLLQNYDIKQILKLINKEQFITSYETAFELFNKKLSITTNDGIINYNEFSKNNTSYIINISAKEKDSFITNLDLDDANKALVHTKLNTYLDKFNTNIPLFF